MKLLVVEKSDIVSNIYNKIFNEKRYEADLVKNELECLAKFDNNYDCVVLEKSDSRPDGSRLEDKIREIKPEQKISFLSPYLESKVESPEFMKGTKDIIEKPFALIALITQLELERP